MDFEAIVKSENSTDSTKYVDHKSHISLYLDLNPPAGSMNSGRNLQTKSPDFMFFKLRVIKWLKPLNSAQYTI